jgi:hypothetical protein
VTGIDEVGRAVAATIGAALERDGELMPIEGLYEEALAQWSTEIDLRLAAEAECRRLRSELARLGPKKFVVAPCNTFALDPTPGPKEFDVAPCNTFAPRPTPEEPRGCE